MNGRLVKLTDCIALEHGIFTIDTGYIRPSFDASYLIVEKVEAALVDVGTSHSVPHILGILQDKGIARRDVRYVMVTHVHLDHAGGAGVLLQHLPEAQLVVHPRGAPHMINPDKLIAGAMKVYGERRFYDLYGKIEPIAAERVIMAPDNFELNLNGRTLVFMDTPGHARHHFCIWDYQSRGIFSGDTFGLSYREFDTDNGPFIFPTTTPVQFDPVAMHDSIERILSFQPQRIYLTHYGCVDNIVPLATHLHGMIDAFVALARDVVTDGERRHADLVAGMKNLLLNALRVHGCRLTEQRILDLLKVDVELNAQGLGIWLDKIK